MQIKLELGDICKSNVDVIVNAAKTSLLGGGGVDGAIHKGAGPDLLKECITLGGCNTGCSKITDAYQLPFKKIIHTVGPVYENYTKSVSEKLLFSCYWSSLSLADDLGYESIAFPCISTGVYGFPSNLASQIVLEALHNFNPVNLKSCTLCCFLESDYNLYSKLLNK